MTFDAFREHGEPTYYSAVHLPWEADILVAGICFCSCILLFSFLLLTPGIAGNEKFLFLLRVFISLSIGTSILVTNFSMTWEAAETTASTKYKAGSGQEVNATIGVNIGLRGVNITLKADDHAIKGETIDYNEKFSWEGLQGRLGFGPFAGRFNREYRAAQLRGLPLPILWVAEYFTLDGEGIRWGRHYRQAGYYAHVLLWLAFPLWVMTNVLFFVLIRYGAIFMILTGLSMVASNITWAMIINRNEIDLRIPFSEHDVLEFSHGASYWICLFTGILCLVLGIIVFFMDKCAPKHIAFFFGVDIIQDSEMIQVEDDSDVTIVKDTETYSNTGFDGGNNGDDSAAVSPSDYEDGIYEESSVGLPPPGHFPNSILDSRKAAVRPLQIQIDAHVKRSFKSSEHRLTKRLQRPRRKDPATDYYASVSVLSATTSTPVNLEMDDMARGSMDNLDTNNSRL